jgi:hypothetical protein
VLKTRPDDHHSSSSNPLKITQKSSKTPFWPNIFFACGALKGASPYGTVLVSPKSATLTVTIIPVTPGSGSWNPGTGEYEVMVTEMRYCFAVAQATGRLPGTTPWSR